MATVRQVFQAIRATDSTLYRLPDGGISLDTTDAHLSTDADRLHDDIVGAITPSIDVRQRADIDGLLVGYQVDVATDDSAAERLVAQLVADAQHSGCLAFDTETAVLDHLLGPVPVSLTKTGTVAKRQPKTGAAGYALNPRKARVRLLQAYGGGDTVGLFDMDLVDWSVVGPLFDSVPALAAFNAVFDVKFLLAGPAVEPTVRIYDTMTAMRLIDGTRDNMARSAKALLDVEIPKGLGASDWHRPTLSADQLNYAAVDALVTFWLWQAQRDHFDGTDEHAQQLADELVVPVARMELAGLPIDRHRHAQKVSEWHDSLEYAQVALTRVTGGRLTGIPTNRQVADYLAQALPTDALTAWPKTASGKSLSVAQATLKNQGDGVVGVDELLAVRAWSKALSTYGGSLAHHIDDDDRIRSSFLIAGARTGRFASRSVNLQNQPKRGKLLAGFRDIFAAKDGNIVVAADYSQIELRIAAEMSADANMRGAFRDGIDLHTRTASMLTDEDEPSKADRTMAKAAAFGLLYGSGVRGFRTYAKAAFGLTLSHDDAVDLIDGFFSAYPNLRHWQRDQERLTRRGGDVTTVGGRRWQFRWRAHTPDDPGIDDLEDWQVGDWLDGYERNFALNHPIQGTAAEVIGVAIGYVDKAIRHLPARIGATVHDEIVIECAADPVVVRAVRRVLAAKMTRAWLEFFPDAPWRGVVDITTGPSWGQQDES